MIANLRHAPMILSICLVSLLMRAAPAPALAETGYNPSYQYYCQGIPFGPPWAKPTYKEDSAIPGVWPSWSGIICNGTHEVGTIQLHILGNTPSTYGGTWRAVIMGQPYAGTLSDFGWYAGLAFALSDDSSPCKLTMVQLQHGAFGGMVLSLIWAAGCGDDRAIGGRFVRFLVWGT